MPVSLRFRCQYCDEQPDPLTQVNLIAAMRQMTFGAYQDALPGALARLPRPRTCSGRTRYCLHRLIAATSWRSCASTTGSVGNQVLAAPAVPVRASRTPTSIRAWRAATYSTPDRRALTPPGRPRRARDAARMPAENDEGRRVDGALRMPDWTESPS